MKIAIDINGGDHAPYEVLKGAFLAGSEFKDLELVLLGNESEIRNIIKKDFPGFSPFSIINVSQKIKMDEAPALSIRKKKDSSIVKGLRLLKKKEVDAFVSCGNTGALVSGGILTLRLIKGVERPGIALMIPTLKEECLLMDVGANVDPKPVHLMQYALMAEVYSKKVLGKENPSIGLLNIGKEEGKGSGFLKESGALLREAVPNFVGNIEPKEIFIGDCDCVICDGLVGNVVLKLSEGVGEVFKHFLLSEIKKNILGLLGLFLVKKSFKKFGERVDYSEYGGAPLLGVDGAVIIGHGQSNAKAVKNAIRVASKEVARDINKNIEKRINNVEKSFLD